MSSWSGASGDTKVGRQEAEHLAQEAAKLSGPALRVEAAAGVLAMADEQLHRGVVGSSRRRWAPQNGM